jgi:hypothetical protein
MSPNSIPKINFGHCGQPRLQVLQGLLLRVSMLDSVSLMGSAGCRGCPDSPNYVLRELYREAVYCGAVLDALNAIRYVPMLSL